MQSIVHGRAETGGYTDHWSEISNPGAGKTCAMALDVDTLINSRGTRVGFAVPRSLCRRP